MDSSIRRALETKSAAAMVAASGARASTQGRRLLSKTADPELAALVRHAGWCGRPGGSHEGEAVEQPGDEKQRDHGDAEAEPGQGELRQQRNRAFTGAAQVAAHADDSVEGGIHECAAVESMAGQRVLGLALRAVVRAVSIRIGDFFGVALDGAGEWV